MAPKPAKDRNMMMPVCHGETRSKGVRDHTPEFTRRYHRREKWVPVDHNTRGSCQLMPNHSQPIASTSLPEQWSPAPSTDQVSD